MKQRRVIISVGLLIGLVAFAAALMVRETQFRAHARDFEVREAKLQREVELLQNEIASLQFNKQERAAKAAAPRGQGGQEAPMRLSPK